MKKLYVWQVVMLTISNLVYFGSMYYGFSLQNAIFLTAIVMFLAAMAFVINPTALVSVGGVLAPLAVFTSMIVCSERASTNIFVLSLVINFFVFVIAIVFVVEESKQKSKVLISLVFEEAIVLACLLGGYSLVKFGIFIAK
jgi:hypothetical protein